MPETNVEDQGVYDNLSGTDRDTTKDCPVHGLYNTKECTKCLATHGLKGDLQDWNRVQDSGNHQEFSTGSKRDSREGKGRYDLVSPLFMRRFTKHFENGAVKYGDRNWEKGQPISRYLDSAMRHLYGYLEGKRDEDHLAAAAWNVHAMIHTEENAKDNKQTELLDLPWQTAVNNYECAWCEQLFQFPRTDLAGEPCPSCDNGILTEYTNEDTG